MQAQDKSTRKFERTQTIDLRKSYTTNGWMTDKGSP